MDGHMHDEKLHDAMDCATVRDQLAFLLYGELSFDEEEKMETHLDACADCRTASRPPCLVWVRNAGRGGSG